MTNMHFLKSIFNYIIIHMLFCHWNITGKSVENCMLIISLSNISSSTSYKWYKQTVTRRNKTTSVIFYKNHSLEYNFGTYFWSQVWTSQNENGSFLPRKAKNSVIHDDSDDNINEIVTIWANSNGRPVYRNKHLLPF